MAKYFGKIGYAFTEETSPDVWKDVVVEKDHYGNIEKHSRRWASSDGVNDNFLINNELSILLDPFVMEHSQHIKYATFMGAKWKVTNIEIEHPRIILTLGGLYNA